MIVVSGLSKGELGCLGEEGQSDVYDESRYRVKSGNLCPDEIGPRKKGLTRQRGKRRGREGHSDARDPSY